MSKLSELKEKFNRYEGFKIFEVSVINKKTNEEDWVCFDISIVKNSLVAQHVALTEKEARSKKIATKKVVLDKDFSINENLLNLYDECLCALATSDFYSVGL